MPRFIADGGFLPAGRGALGQQAENRVQKSSLGRVDKRLTYPRGVLLFDNMAKLLHDVYTQKVQYVRNKYIAEG